MQANDKVILKARSLSRFDNSSILTKGEVILATFAERVITDMKFQVIDADMAYNIILERPLIHDMDVVSSTLHQVLKFPSQWGIKQIRGNQRASRSINSTDVDSRPDVIQKPEKNEIIKTTTEELKVVILFVHWPDRKVYIGANLRPEMKDMTGILPKVMTHKLNEDPLHPPVKQIKRKQGAFKNQVIQDEV
ncbi:uncharacterized protein LOC142172121 [Nicotiana tabacum]|uniref:Uncharacterized protein LOC142172121 n=1 Tax=Nicotiana tabacum TaxID=4097 RepID=A0AC58T435_TOBAC